MMAGHTMKRVKIALVSEGSADAMLEHVIRWLAGDVMDGCIVDFLRPDFGRHPAPPKDMSSKAAFAADMCDVLCIHRDANNAGIEKRQDEIRRALGAHAEKGVCLVPVYETEAWFLIDSGAILQAAGAAKNTTVKDLLPSIEEIEGIKDPKELLHGVLKKASGKRGRKLKKFDAPQRAHRVADLITDYSPLRKLPAFRAFESDFKRALNNIAKPV